MSERCEFCGRFGAQKSVEDRGPNGRGGRQTITMYLCVGCSSRLANLERPVSEHPLSCLCVDCLLAYHRARQ